MMRAEEYIQDPCRASALPFWKTEQVRVPESISVLREDKFIAEKTDGTDEPYFRLVCFPQNTERPELPAAFETAECGTEEYAEHINSCYREEGVTPEEMAARKELPVYDPALWIAVRDRETGQIAATGIAELDARIGEGILEWIQVSPEYKRKGLGKYIVKELLYRMKDKAKFVTVSGKVNNPDNPYALYCACGFGNPVTWHVVRKD